MPNCIFCKIARGELPAMKVYEDDATMVFLTIQPTHAGHVLVIPKEHAMNVFEASPELWGRVQETVRKVAVAVEKSMGSDGVNINMNNREHAGQLVDHLHIHIIPRFRDDNLKLFPHHDIRPDEGEPVAAKIRAAL